MLPSKWVLRGSSPLRLVNRKTFPNSNRAWDNLFASKRFRSNAPARRTPATKPPSTKPPRSRNVSPSAPSHETPSLSSDIFSATIALLTAFCTGYLFVTYVGSFRSVFGPSMYPTMDFTGETVYVSYLYKRGRGIKVGDIISFRHPVRSEITAMKRVIGMPGDFVLRNTPRGYGSEKDPSYKPELIQVPEGHCWVVGDNMEFSRDSRHFGPLPLALVLGKAVSRKVSKRFALESLDGTLKDFDDSD